MKRLILLLFLIPQLLLCQNKTQHEPERIFKKILNEKKISDFAIENKIIKISFFRDTVLSSSIEFDKNGNAYREITMENNFVKETIYKFDNQNRILETKYYTPNGEFSYGYYYKYDYCSAFRYNIKDSILYEKRTLLKSENINIYSQFDNNGELIYKNIDVRDNEMKSIFETSFQHSHIDRQILYEYIDNKKYITLVQFDNNGTKISEERFLSEIKKDNKVEHYSTDDKRLFRIDYFDKKDNLIKFELLDKNGNIELTETLMYNSEGQLTEHVIIDLGRDQMTKYAFKYDTFGKIENITKEFNGVTENFRYVYELE